MKIIFSFLTDIPQEINDNIKLLEILENIKAHILEKSDLKLYNLHLNNKSINPNDTLLSLKLDNDSEILVEHKLTDDEINKIHLKKQKIIRNNPSNQNNINNNINNNVNNNIKNDVNNNIKNDVNNSINNDVKNSTISNCANINNVQQFKIIENNHPYIKSYKCMNKDIYENNCNLIQYKTDPTNIKYIQTFCKDSYSSCIENSFEVFQTYNDNISYLLYNKKQKNSLICYSINDNKIVKVIENAHDDLIICIKHCPDMKNKKDYLVTSSYDNSIKVWDVNNWKVLSIIRNVYTKGLIWSATILFDYIEIEYSNDTNLYHHNQCDKDSKYSLVNAFIISGGYNFEPMKIFSSSGAFLGNIGPNEWTLNITWFYEKNLNKVFIINSNNKDIKAYDFTTLSLYKNFCHVKAREQNRNSKIVCMKNVYKLFESDSSGFLHIWDFNTGKLIKSFNCLTLIDSFVLWNENWILVSGCGEKYIKIIDINKGQIIKSFGGGKGKELICGLKKVIHPSFGEILISIGKEGSIIAWGIGEKK